MNIEFIFNKKVRLMFQVQKLDDQMVLRENKKSKDRNITIIRIEMVKKILINLKKLS